MFERMFHLSQSVFYSVVYCFLISIFLFHFLIAGQAVYGDGIGYYAHLHTWVFDSDWNYSNEYRHVYAPENNNAPSPNSVDDVQIVSTTKDGLAANHFFNCTVLTSY